MSDEKVRRHAPYANTSCIYECTWSGFPPYIVVICTYVPRSAGRAGAAGLSLTNALSVTSLLSWAVRNAAECESMMNSVERVLYTTEHTPLEGHDKDRLRCNLLCTSMQPHRSCLTGQSFQDHTLLPQNCYRVDGRGEGE
jgi:hypothetical protein